MPSFEENLNNLTIKEIKDVMRQNGIETPKKNATKSVLIELCRGKVEESFSDLPGEQQMFDDSLILSTDDESIIPISYKKKKTKSKKTKKIERDSDTIEAAIPAVVELETSGTFESYVEKQEVITDILAGGDTMDAYSLSDEELSQQLKALGEDIGPVIDSTRSVYQRKLDRLLRGEAWVPPAVDEFSDEDDTDAVVDTPVPQRQTRSAVVRQRVVTQEVREEVHETSTTDSAPNRTLLDDIVTRVEPQPEVEVPKKGRSLFWQLSILFAIALIIFLVLMNLEPAGSKNTIGKISG